MIKLKDFIQLNNIIIGDTIIEGSFYNAHYTIIAIEEDFVRVKYDKSYGAEIKLLEDTFFSHWQKFNQR